jgi:hypothetical protein
MAHKEGLDIERTLLALGELLAAEGVEIGVVVLGGAALNLLGIVERTTRDVDILAITNSTTDLDQLSLHAPDPLPEPLTRAIIRVARDFGLPEDWANTTVGAQWKTGLPYGLVGRVHWRRYGGLIVGLVGRYDLIFFKLYAAADSGGTSSVHYQDLLALRPTKKELKEAAKWIQGQDPSPGFATILDQVIKQVKKHVG